MAGTSVRQARPVIRNCGRWTAAEITIAAGQSRSGAVMATMSVELSSKAAMTTSAPITVPLRAARRHQRPASIVPAGEQASGSAGVTAGSGAGGKRFVSVLGLAGAVRPGDGHSPAGF